MPDRLRGARERPLAPPAFGGAAPHEGHHTLARPSHARGAAPTLLNLSEKSRR